MATTYQPKGIGELTQKVILDGSEQVLIADGFQAKRASISDVLSGAGLSQAARTKLNSAVTAAQLNTAVDAAKTQLEQSITSGLATKANTADLNQKADVSSLSAYATTQTVSDLVEKVNQKADATALAPLATTQALNTLATTVANKIDATALTPYATKAYVDRKVGTAFDPSALEPLATKEALEELKTVVAGKAAKTDLTSLATKGELLALTTIVSGKADASALATMATKEDVEDVSQQLKQKADVSALNGYATTGALATVQTALDAKADAATLNAAIQNITTLQQVQATKANASDLAALATKDDVNQADERIKADLAKKVDAEEGKGLSTNDFTNALKAKLENMASGAGGSASLDDVKATVESEVKKSIGALNLDTRFSGKADVTELANYVTTTDFNGYKTEVTAALGEKATTIQVQSAVAGLISETAADGKYVLKADLAKLKTEVEGKATAADITTALAPYATTKALTDALATKADASALTGLATTESVSEALMGYATKEDIKGIATSGAIKSIQDTLDTKADKSQLTSLATKSEVTTALADKADTSVLANYETKADLTDKLSQKADASALVGLARSSDLTGLATKQEVQALSTAVSDKADATALATLATKHEVSDGLASKADTKALTAYATTAALTALKTEVDGKIGEEDLEDYETTAEVDRKLGQKADASSLANYETKTDLTTRLAGYATKEDIKGIATDGAIKLIQTELEKKATKAELTELATKQEVQTLSGVVSGKADATALTGLATKEDLKAKADVSALSSLATKNELNEIRADLDTRATKRDLVNFVASSDLAEVSRTVATKANSSALDDYERKSDLQAKLATKADTSVLKQYALKTEVPAAVDTSTFATKTELTGYVQKEAGKVLSSNDYTNAHKAAVDGIVGKTFLTAEANTNEYNLFGYRITNLLSPVKAEHAANKEYVDTLINSLSSTYVLRESGKGLSTNDFTAALKSKLETINTANLMGLVGPFGGWDARTKVVDNVADPTAPAHAANKRYVDTAVGKIDLSGYVQKEAGKGLSEVNFTNAILNDHNTVVNALRNRVVMSRSTVSGAPFDAENRNIERVLAPTLDLHAANKAYVDAKVSAVTTDMSKYVMKDGNKGLSENDFTTEYRNQLTSLNNYFGGMVALRRAASATAAFDADGRRITGLAAPTAPTDAVSKTYVDSAVGTGLTKASVGPNNGLYDAKSLRIVNVPTPSQATDAANKAYVDGKINFSGTPLTYSSSTVVAQSGGISGLVKNVTEGVRFQGATLADTNDGHTVNDHVVLTAGRLRDVISPVTAVGSTTVATFAAAGALRVTKTIDATGQEIRGNLVIDSAVNNRRNATDPVSYGVFNSYFVQGGTDLHIPRHTYFRANAGLASTNSRYNKDTGHGFITSETNSAMSNKNLFTAFQDIPPLVRWMFTAFGFKSINTTPTADRTDNKQGTVGGGFWNTPPGGSISGFQLPSWLGGWAVFGGHISNVPSGLLVDIAWPVSGVTNSWCVMNPFAGHANYFATVHPSKFMRFIIKNAYNNGEASQRISVFFLAVVKAST